MAKFKKSASQLAAEAEYFAKHNIKVPEVSKKTSGTPVIHEPNKEQKYGIIPNLKDFGIYISSINNCVQRRDMDDRNLLKEILRHYDEVLNYIIRPEIFAEPVKVKQFLIDKGVDKGICRYSRVYIGVPICERWWIKEYSPNDEYWFPTSENVWTSKEMVLCISRRVERLTEILNSLE